MLVKTDTCHGVQQPLVKSLIVGSRKQMDVSKNSGTPKLSIFIGFSIINHPFWGTLIFGNTQMIEVGRKVPQLLWWHLPRVGTSIHHRFSLVTLVFIAVENLMGGCELPAFV